jgi:hypothetical protein
MNNDIILQKIQAGLESTRGTNVAATRVVYAQGAASYERSLQTFVDTTGTYEARRRTTYGRQSVGMTFTDLATFEDLPWWFQLAIKGGVAGVGDGGSPIAYAYTFVPSLATDDLKSATVEFNHTGNVYESGQVMVNTWTLRGDSDSDDEPGWMFEAECMARDWATSTFTGALTDRTTEVIKARGTKLYIDDAGGTIGTTQVTGRLISWSITGNNNVQMKAWAEDETSMAANKVSRGERTLDAQITLEFDSDAEFDDYRTAGAPVQKLVRLESEGSEIHAGGTPQDKRLRFDILGYWSAAAFGERTGSRIITLSLAAYYDATAAKSFSAEVYNALITLP